MGKHPQFEEIREEIEAKQRTVLFEDGLNAGKSVDEFLWKGDPKAKPIQRAGLAFFACMSFFLSGLSILILLKGGDWPSWTFGTISGTICLIVGVRFMRNVFLRPNKLGKYEKDCNR